jgi:membrane protease YdiL (CAAX protease family)
MYLDHPVRDRSSVLSPHTSRAVWVWAAWVVGALLLLPVVGGAAYAVVVAGSALVLTVWYPGRARSVIVAGRDLTAIAVMYVAVVALLAAAFRGFSTDHVAGLFLCFAGALLVGTVGPVVYTVWVCRRPLADLGLRRDNWALTLRLALLFGGVQFALTLWGYDLPAAEDWVPLLVMALVVGVFESIFFRGFVQGRLEEAFGSRVGIAGAAVLYGAYHVGYGMGLREMLFLTGLGVVYAVAYALPRNVFVLWPLLTPVGSFFANVEAGDIDLPWASIMGFADVLALMVAAIWLGARHARRTVPGG